MEIDNDLRNGMMQKISKGVKSRKRGEPLRVIYDASMPKDLLKRVMNKLNLDKLDTVLGGGKYHNHKDLMRFPDCGRKDLKYPEWTPVLKNELSGNVGMLELIRRKIVLFMCLIIVSILISVYCRKAAIIKSKKYQDNPLSFG